MAETEDEFIPLLKDLPGYRLIRVSPAVREALSGEEEQPWSIPEDFVPRWIAAHGGDEDRAQDHWEQLVQRISRTDAVEKHLEGAKATRQAVTAAVILLRHPASNYRCGQCPPPATADRTLDMNDAESDQQATHEGSAP